MDAELKARWTAALRSGEYKQGKFRLKTEGGAYCCLGVLTSLLGESPDGDVGDISAQCYQPATKALGDSTVILKLSNLNDKCDQTFAQIADYIDANL